ncbi:MAG: TfoX/Sxy family protein [Bacteroidales bacterium]|nr:TfoX/Sxy family protein [Bacteroidales bacterium]
MASSESFKTFILEQLADAGDVRARKMFGEYCLYLREKLVGVIADDRLFIKPTAEVESILKTVKPLPPYDGAKDSFYIEEVDNREYLCELVKTAYQSLPMPKEKKKKKK